jgi:hypothetical protein
MCTPPAFGPESRSFYFSLFVWSPLSMFDLPSGQHGRSFTGCLSFVWYRRWSHTRCVHLGDDIPLGKLEGKSVLLIRLLGSLAMKWIQGNSWTISWLSAADWLTDVRAPSDKTVLWEIWISVTAWQLAYVKKLKIVEKSFTMTLHAQIWPVLRDYIH